MDEAEFDALQFEELVNILRSYTDTVYTGPFK